MNSTTKNILIIALLIAVPVGIIMPFRADTVGNHIAALEHAAILEQRPPAKNRLWRILLINFVYQKAPSGNDSDSYAFHRDALVRLDHLERRAFIQPDWKGAKFDRSSPFQKLVYRTLLEILRSDPVLSKVGSFNYDSTLPGMVVYCPPSAMPKFEKAIDELTANALREIP